MAPPAHRTSTPAYSPRRVATLWSWLAAVLFILPHPAAAQDVPPVKVQRAEKAPIVEEVRVTGTVTSPRVAQVSTSVGGLVKEMHVDSGHRVEAGAPLLELDRELEALELRQERAAVEEVREELADARRRLSEAERLARDQNLPESELRAREAEVRVAAATLERLQARADHQAARLERHRVEAPFTGVVARKRTAAGEWVEPGTPVVELVAVEELRLDFQAPQSHYPRIDEGTPVRVHLETAGDDPLEGEVGATIPVSDPEARTFTVRVHVDRDAAPLTPGMSASATLLLETGREGIVVPRDALLRHPDGRETVWVAREEGDKLTVQEQQVETGLTFDGQVEIPSGIGDGDRVVTRGNESLEEGQEVRPVDGG